MLPLYGLRKRLGLADLRGRRWLAKRAPSALEAQIARLQTGQTAGAPGGDEQLTERIARSYRQGVADFAGYGQSMWSGINGLAAPLHALLLGDNARALTTALDNPHNTNLLLGFDNPVVAPYGFESDDRNLLSNEIGPGAAERIYLALKRLAEAVGAVNLANPETLTGTALEPDAYLSLIEERIGAPLSFPNFYPREEGLETERGIVSYRPLQAIYQAWRLKQLGADKVLEIGGGLGRTAYYARAFGIGSYTIVDLPLSSVAQAHFLSRALGAEQVGLADDPDRPVRLRGPSFAAETDERFDVILNVDSLSEMDGAVARDYVVFARRSAPLLLSINREWDGAPRTAALVGRAPTMRYPYWMREGYVEELVRWPAPA